MSPAIMSEIISLYLLTQGSKEFLLGHPNYITIISAITLIMCNGDKCSRLPGQQRQNDFRSLDLYPAEKTSWREAAEQDQI